MPISLQFQRSPYRPDLEGVRGGLDPSRQEDLQLIQRIKQDIASGNVDESRVNDFISKHPKAAPDFESARINAARIKRAQQIIQSGFTQPQAPFEAAGPPTRQGELPVATGTQGGFEGQRVTRGILNEGLMTPDVQRQIQAAAGSVPSATQDSPFTKINPKDYTRESLAAYARSRNVADLVPLPKEPLVSITNKGVDEGLKELNKKFGQKFTDEYDENLKRADSIVAVEEARQALDSDIIAGFAGDFRLGLAKALNLVGANNAETIANTEGFFAQMAKETAQIIKAFGSGTGLSDADREYAQKAAGGAISLNKESIKRILNMNQHMKRKFIERFNKRAVAAKKRYGDKLMFDPVIQIPEIRSGSSDEDLIRKYLK